MNKAALVKELSPGAARAYEAALSRASSINSIPQHEELLIGLEDGWDCWLKRYQYLPLTQANEIRLLRIHPWKDRLRTNQGNLPRCELIHVTLDSSPEFAAISYAWGDLREYSPVVLHEEECMNVTNSLFSVLCRLCGDEPLDFWADQLCINQYDLAERSSQVKLMGKIFGQACMTFVWLGNSDDTTKSAFDLINNLAHSDLTLIKSFELLVNGDLGGLKSILQPRHINLDDTEPGWTGIERLSLSPWFSRLWTFQEIVLAQDLVFMCGAHHCSQDDLLQAFYATQLLHKCSTVGMSNTQLLRIYRTSGYECKEPRDRVYAVLALQDKQNSCAIHVDYSEPIEILFRETAKAIIINTGSLGILHRRRFGYVENLPSWAPDWASRNTDKPIDDGRMRFSSSNGLRHIFEESPCGYLITKGKIIARISRVATHSFTEYQTQYLEGDIQAFLGRSTLIPQVTAALEKYLGNEGMLLERRKEHVNWLVAMTFTCGRFKGDGEADFNTDNTESHLDLATIIAARGPSFVRSLAKCHGRKIGILDTHTCPLGLVPDFARAGDIICVLSGSTTPLVLRKAGQDFELVGECYVHGVMYGEAVNWSQEGGDSFRIK